MSRDGDDDPAGQGSHPRDPHDRMSIAQDETETGIVEQAPSRPAIRLLAQHAMDRSGMTSGPHRSVTRSVAITGNNRTKRDETMMPGQKSSSVPPSSSPSSGTPFPRPFYTSAQWTADGTTIIATSSAQSISSFVLPADLLQPAPAARALQPHATLRLPEPTQAVASAPYFSLADPSSQHLLAGCRDHPVQLYHAFPTSSASGAGDGGSSEDARTDCHDGRPAPLGSYKLIRKESEQYITPASLLWAAPGAHFICGSANRLDCFDISRPGSDGPILTIPTIPSRRHISKGHGVGMKGTVAALAASPADGILAAGTWTRWMGLYDLHRTDRVVANWSVANAATDTFASSRIASTSCGQGQGIVQTIWSPCGRYLVINERHATSLLVYDIRVTGQLLSVLAGRTSSSQQRLRCDVFLSGTNSGFDSPGHEGYGSGFEVWAGCQDGRVAVWESVGALNDVQHPSWSWRAHDSSPVGGAAVHQSGSVVATCSGGWTHSSSSSSADDPDLSVADVSATRVQVFDESSIKIWSLA